MKCISFGYVLLFSILLAIVFAFLPQQVHIVGMVASFGLFVWWIASFFVTCTGGPGTTLVKVQ